MFRKPNTKVRVEIERDIHEGTKLLIGSGIVAAGIGYSMFVYIPVAIICIFPWIGQSIDWLAISIAMLTSGSVLAINFWKAAQEAKRPWILGAIALCHIGLSLAFKFYFFRHTTVVLPVAAPAPGNSPPTRFENSTTPTTTAGFEAVLLLQERKARVQGPREAQERWLRLGVR